MIRKLNLSREQLREKFLEIAEGENWFTEFYRPLEDSNGGNGAAAAAATAAAATNYDGGAHQAERVQALFGSPPYEFLQPGDAPPQLLSAERKRQRSTVRNPDDSEYAAMRGTTINYASNPKRAQFVDSANKDTQRRYWLPGTNFDAFGNDASQIYDELKRVAARLSSEQTLELNFLLPIHTKRTRPDIGVPQVNERVMLYYFYTSPTRTKGAASSQSPFIPIATVLVESTRIAPFRSTGIVIVRLLGPLS